MFMLEGVCCIHPTVSEHPVLQSQALQVLEHCESVGDLLHPAETNVPHPADVDVKTKYYDRDKYYLPQILDLQWPVFRDDDSVFQRLINSARPSGVAVFKSGLRIIKTTYTETVFKCLSKHNLQCE